MAPPDDPVSDDVADGIADRRAKRRKSQSAFDALVTGYAARPGAGRGMMFGSEGIKHDGSFFAFVGHDGGLIMKLPADCVRALIAAGTGGPVQTGARPMREWVEIPVPDDGSTDRWSTLLQEAYEYAVLRSA